MATPEHHQPPNKTINKTSGTGSGIIIGILVILVIGFGFYFFSGSDPVGGPSDVNVTVEGAADPAGNTAPAPAPAPAAPADQPATGTTNQPSGN